MDTFKFFKQLDSMDCGPACLKMIAYHYGKSFSLTYLREHSHIEKTGVSVAGILWAASDIELKGMAVKIPFYVDAETPSLVEAPLPVIVHWNQNHFVVVYKTSKKYVWIADPGSGKHKLTIAAFKDSWISDKDKGIAVLFEPTANFENLEEGSTPNKGLSYILSYLKPHTKLGIQLLLGLLVGTLIQLILPFLTQNIVDIGIDTKNIGFIYIVLIAQVALQIFSLLSRSLQSWILLHISTRINVSLISDFLFKMMKLPLYFFESKNTGDLLQRIGDHARIESFLTNALLNILLAVINIIVFGAVLVYYSTNIFFIFIGASILYILWVTIFLKYRKDIDYSTFRQMSDNQDSLIEIIQGMPEIKLQGSEDKRRMKWAVIQAKLFRLQMRSLAITQYQDGGAITINQLKDVLISIFTAIEVVEGRMTLGMMLAVQYIIGQLNGPINQMIGFIRSAQDAKISLDRLAEVNEAQNEEDAKIQKVNTIPSGDLTLNNISYRYSDISDYVLENVSFTIPRGKTTAIVGASGSGKTTLVKLLLQFDKVKKGSITLGGIDINAINLQVWRANCGAVLQDGFIFSDTIAANIAESDQSTDMVKVYATLDIANIKDFVQELPLQYNTMIGARGSGLSQGQKQRLFIARALYKNPEFLFFDEATNSLDATNERQIVEKLDMLTKGKTTVVVAHRLSTVKNADQIIVLDKGRVVEQGSHKDLVVLKGYYYQLVSNQLELGN